MADDVSDDDIIGDLFGNDEKPKKSKNKLGVRTIELEELPPLPDRGFASDLDFPEPTSKDTLDVLVAEREKRGQEIAAATEREILRREELDQARALERQKIETTRQQAATDVEKQRQKDEFAVATIRRKGEANLEIKKQNLALTTEKQLADYNAAASIQEKALTARGESKLKGFERILPSNIFPEVFGGEADARRVGISSEQYRLIKKRADAGVPFEHQVGYYDKKGNLRYKREAITPASIAFQVAEIKKKNQELEAGRQNIEIKRQQARAIASSTAARDQRTYSAQSAYPAGFGISGSEGPYRRSRGVRFGSTNFGQTPIYVSGHDGGKLRSKYVLGGVPGVAYALQKGREGASNMGSRVFGTGTGNMLNGPPTTLRIGLGASTGNSTILSKLSAGAPNSNVLAKLAAIKPRPPR